MVRAGVRADPRGSARAGRRLGPVAADFAGGAFAAAERDQIAQFVGVERAIETDAGDAVVSPANPALILALVDLDRHRLADHQARPAKVADPNPFGRQLDHQSADGLFA